MPWAAVAIPAAVNLISSFASSQSERSAANKAADAQVNAARIGADLQRYIYDMTRSDYQPYREAGYGALPEQRKFADLFSGAVLNPSSFKESPAFNFNLNQGIKAIERSATSRGKLDSSQNLKDLMTFGQGLAANEYQQYLQNLLGAANVYGGIAGTGQSATTSLGQLGAGYAGNQANLALNAGRAQAGGIINAANARTGLYQNISRTANNAIDRYYAYSSINSPWSSPSTSLPYNYSSYGYEMPGYNIT